MLQGTVGRCTKSGSLLISFLQIDIAAIPGEKTIKGYYEWAVAHHQIASETLVPRKIILDPDNKFAVLESLTEFRGRQGKDRDDFFGWGPISEGTGPIVKMIVFYHLDDAGRITHLEPAVATLFKRADGLPINSGSAIKSRATGFYTKEHVRDYIRLFSTNRFAEASAFWAPKLKVTLGPTVINGREENIDFFTEQRAGNVNENVEPTEITLDESSCALRAVVTFTALRDFPEVERPQPLLSSWTCKIC